MEFGWDYLFFATALSVAAFTPGPGIAAIVATALARGARKAFCVVPPLCLAAIVILTTVFAVYILTAEKARHTIKNVRVVRIFNRATADALGGAVAWIASR